VGLAFALKFYDKHTLKSLSMKIYGAFKKGAEGDYGQGRYRDMNWLLAKKGGFEGTKAEGLGTS
jgi:hypothetical protein